MPILGTNSMDTCRTCEDVRSELVGLKTFVAEWFSVLLQKFEMHDKQMYKLVSSFNDKLAAFNHIQIDNNVGKCSNVLNKSRISVEGAAKRKLVKKSGVPLRSMAEPPPKVPAVNLSVNSKPVPKTSADSQQSSSDVDSKPILSSSPKGFQNRTLTPTPGQPRVNGHSVANGTSESYDQAAWLKDIAEQELINGTCSKRETGQSTSNLVADVVNSCVTRDTDNNCSASPASADSFSHRYFLDADEDDTASPDTNEHSDDASILGDQVRKSDFVAQFGELVDSASDMYNMNQGCDVVNEEASAAVGSSSSQQAGPHMRLYYQHSPVILADYVLLHPGRGLTPRMVYNSVRSRGVRSGAIVAEMQWLEQLGFGKLVIERLSKYFLKRPPHAVPSEAYEKLPCISATSRESYMEAYEMDFPLPHGSHWIYGDRNIRERLEILYEVFEKQFNTTCLGLTGTPPSGDAKDEVLPVFNEETTPVSGIKKESSSDASIQDSVSSIINSLAAKMSS